MHQVEMISLEELVPESHSYRTFIHLWSFKYANKQLRTLEQDNNYKGYGVLRLFKCLLLQFMENLSDRELERFLQENVSAQWFCGFHLSEGTPNFTLFSKVRKRIGTKVLSKIFSELRDQLKSNGLMNEVFSFVDASHLVTKASLWKERDEAIKQKYEQLNNDVLPKVAHDKEARIGCKGKEKYGYGYKKHTSVDMQSGLINKIAITPANLTDSKGTKHICPSRGAVYADKGYCDKHARKATAKKGVHWRAIKKNNMKGKNKELDRWISRIRSPYERVFSKQQRRVRYCGMVKNQFAAFMDAICFHLKRLAILDPPGLTLA